MQKKNKKNMSRIRLKRELPMHIMLIPAVAAVFIFAYVPMGGLVIALQKFIPARGLFGDQQWVGLDNFRYLLRMPGSIQALRNTVVIAFFKMLFNLVIPITVAILLNEVKSDLFKRSVQTVIYLPHFLSWIILSGVFVDILSPTDGIVNRLLETMGIEPIFFLGSNKWFQPTIVITDVWKNFGFGTIIYLAAITNIDPGLYEAAKMDGANRWHKTIYITLPGMYMVVILMGVLSLGNVLNAGFEQVYNMYSLQVYETGDIIDTFIYRIGLKDAQFGVATAMGLFKSLVSFVFISVSYYVAYKFFDYRIF